MMKFTNPPFLMACIMFFGLSACVDPSANSAGGTAKPLPAITLPEEMVKTGIAVGMAETIAEQCRREFRFNYAEKQAVIDGAASRYPEFENYTGAQVDAALSDDAMERRIQNVVFDYVKKRNILMSDAATWCNAGRFEVANKTAIGRYLIVK